MADSINQLARRLGAKVVAQVPDTGGGAFGAARLATIVANLQFASSRLAAGEPAVRPTRPGSITRRCR